MKKFDGKIIFTDIDGTIYDSKIGIPQENIDAVNYFIENGGKFALATGRAMNAVKPFFEIIKINAPCIIYNGGAIYDFYNNKYLFKEYINQKAYDYVKKIIKDYPNIGVAAATDDGYYYLVDPEKCITKFHIDVIYGDYTIDNFEKPVYKFIFSVNDEDGENILKDLENRKYDGIRFSASQICYIDMLSDTISKGEAVEKYSCITSTPLKDIITVGNYYNDIEMLNVCENSACVKGSPKELMNVCKYHLCELQKGAIKNLIKILEDEIKNEK